VEDCEGRNRDSRRVNDDENEKERRDSGNSFVIGILNFLNF
jgi:hypothetical protein